jgi:hypothetical protein
MSANERARLVFGILVIGGLSVVGLGCSDSGGSGNPIVDPSPVNVAGDYTVTELVTSDTCGGNYPATMTSQVRLTPTGIGLELTEVGAGGSCSTGECHQSGDIVTQTTTETLSNGTCTVTVQTTATLTFEGTYFTSIENRHYAYDSGDCLDFTSCDVVIEGQGSICTDCWAGCSSPSPILVLGTGSRRIVFEMATVDE